MHHAINGIFIWPLTPPVAPWISPVGVSWKISQVGVPVYYIGVWLSPPAEPQWRLKSSSMRMWLVHAINNGEKSMALVMVTWRNCLSGHSCELGSLTTHRFSLPFFQFILFVFLYFLFFSSFIFFCLPNSKPTRQAGRWAGMLAGRQVSFSSGLHCLIFMPLSLQNVPSKACVLLRRR